MRTLLTFCAPTMALIVFLSAMTVPTTDAQAQSAPCNPAVERCR